jgi:hypothetical protein
LLGRGLGPAATLGAEGDIRPKLLALQEGWHPLTRAVAPLEAAGLDDVVEREAGDWQVLYCMAEWPGPPRVIGLLVLPKTPETIAPGGLGVNLLRGIISGLPDIPADWLTERFADSARLGGPQEVDDMWLRDTHRAAERELAKRPRANQGFGEAFYARIARDAVSLRHKHVYAALQMEYAQDDPRPSHRRARPITIGMLKQWVSTARHSFGFLAPGMFAPTERLTEYEKGTTDGPEE